MKNFHEIGPRSWRKKLLSLSNAGAQQNALFVPLSFEKRFKFAFTSKRRHLGKEKMNALPVLLHAIKTDIIICQFIIRVNLSFVSFANLSLLRIKTNYYYYLNVMHLILIGKTSSKIQRLQN